MSFFKVLKKFTAKKTFEWTNETNESFKQMKKYVLELPTLTSPIRDETLYIYLAVSTECVSAVLLTKREHTQKPMYFVSRILQGAEVSYPEMEKLVLALVHATRRLRRYFQGYPIVVLIDKPLRQILMKPEKSGRIAKWAIKLGAYEIEYKARHTVKGQMTDFITEIKEEGNSVKHTTSLAVTVEAENEVWELYTNGASILDGCGASIKLISPDGKEFTYAL